MGIKLCNDNLQAIADAGMAQVPGYNPTDVTAGILHIGPSAFFRAHLAEFVDDALAQREANGQTLNWGIRSVSLRHADARDALEPQDYLYSVTTTADEISKPRIIGSLTDVIYATENPQQALEAAADHEIKLITLTVTQDGYYFDRDTGVDFQAKDIKACLDSSSPEMSSIGLIVGSLALRKERGIAPPIIMSCDNMPDNGAKLRGAVTAYAREFGGDELHDWIAKNVQFSNTMVDRITPQTVSEFSNYIGNVVGLEEAWPIQTEPQPNLPLVIEHKGEEILPEPLQLLQDAGARITDDVNPYALLKGRTLNGVHMALGYIGNLSGHTYTHEAMSDPKIRSFAEGFMKETGATLLPTNGVSHKEFRDDTASRLDNKQMGDQLTRLGRNGSDKLPSKFIAPIKELHAMNDGPQAYQHLSFAIASWIQYAKQFDETGRLNATDKDPNDKDAEAIGLTRLITDDMTDPASVFAIRKIFGANFNEDIIHSVRTHLTLIHEHGIESALETFLEARKQGTGLVNEPANTELRHHNAPPDGLRLRN